MFDALGNPSILLGREDVRAEVEMVPRRIDDAHA
jgi:hypothetical protein